MSKMLFIFVTSMQSSARLNPLARVEKMRGTECKSKKHTCLPPTFPFVRKAVKRVLQLRTDIERMTRTLNVHHQNTSRLRSGFIYHCHSLLPISTIIVTQREMAAPWNEINHRISGRRGSIVQSCVCSDQSNVVRKPLIQFKSKTT